MRIGVGATVAEVEGIVEIGGVGALGVLEHRLEPVEALGEAGLGSGHAVVLIPAGEEPLPRGIGQGGEQRHVLALAGCLVADLLRGGHVAGDGLAEVVDDQELDQPGDVDLRQRLGERGRHDAEPPAVLGGALGPALARVAAAKRVLQRLRGPEEREVAVDVSLLGHVSPRVRGHGRPVRGARVRPFRGSACTSCPSRRGRGRCGRWRPRSPGRRDRRRRIGAALGRAAPPAIAGTRAPRPAPSDGETCDAASRLRLGLRLGARLHLGAIIACCSSWRHHLDVGEQCGSLDAQAGQQASNSWKASVLYSFSGSRWA